MCSFAALGEMAILLLCSCSAMIPVGVPGRRQFSQRPQVVFDPGAGPLRKWYFVGTAQHSKGPAS